MLRNMRTPILAVVLGLSLAGCLTIGDSGSASTGGGDDDTGSSSGSGSNMPDTARVDVSVDKPTVATELKTVNALTVTVTGSGGFSGNVALAASVVDASQAAIPGWTVDLSVPTVTLPENGTATALATVHVPSQTPVLTGTVKITSTSAATLGTPAASSTITAANQVTFAVKYDPAIQGCVYPADGGTAATPVKVAQTTKIRFFNNGADNIVIHVTESAGIPITHQGQTPNGTADPVTEPNTAYEQTPIGTGPASWYCHSTPAGAGKDPGAAGPRVLVQ